MHLRTESALETRLAAVLMRHFFPCDLGEGIEVVHDVEVIEIEMDCDLEDDAWHSAPYERIEIQFDPAAAAPAIEDLSSRERVAAFHINATENCSASDTLPFAPYEPIDVRADSSAPIVTGEIVTGRGAPATPEQTTPYVRSEPDTIPFVRYYVQRARPAKVGG
jgi:hypothetical protein